MSYDAGNRIVGAAVSGPGATLDLIRRGRANTRADLVEVTGLARSTLAQRLDALLAAGLIIPDGEGTSTGGRPPARFRFTAVSGVFLIADIGASHLRCAATDLAGTVLAEEASPLDVAAGPHPVLEQVTGAFAALLVAARRFPMDVR